ncbi:MAG: aminoglycoside phosphotransferase family protein [Thermomicrobiales bacterium]|nr:aminoglycoside phosphotransferase family protein [Thermomicrobiales bacterium]MCO5218440.1 aminoglycoside phosphotransferase family protein [Thermomicrobiales bacterium]MCO5228542.1 aminoglycoside phosphotransferase family protein [Thermomicrobiales bacterium]
MDGTDRRQRARQVIPQLAEKLELSADLTILSERWNTVARLGDSGVIAKAATLAEMAKADPLHWFQLEIEVCRTLADQGGPVHRPYADGLYIVDGLPITLWHEVEGEMGEATEVELVESLATVHRLGGDLLRDEPWFATITTHFADVFPKLHDRSVIDPIALGQLKDRYQELMELVVAANLMNGFIHGDAQRKNAMATDNGAVWIDFEECSYGPIAWDLACLTMHRRFDTDRVLDYYAEMSGHDRIRNADTNTLKQLRDLEGLTWMLAIQDEREPEFKAETASLLRDVLAAQRL